MSQDDFLGDRRRANEAEYFRKHEQALIEKLRARAAREKERSDMGAVLNVADEELLQELQEMGFNRDTINLLHLIPLIQVAWSDGQVTSRQLAEVLEIARARGVEPDSPSFAQLMEWINQRPSDEFFQTSLRVINAMLGGLSPVEEEASKKDLVAYCTAVAAASGGILGFGRKISQAEQTQIERIAAELETRESP